MLDDPTGTSPATVLPEGETIMLEGYCTMTHKLITATMMATWCLVLGAGAYAQQKEAPAGQKPATTGTEKPATAGTAKAEARAEMKDRDGKTIGRATLSETPHGVLIDLQLEGAQAGERAFHIHQVGRCEGPAFESAGGHFNPASAQHGLMNAKGPHAGDLPNIHVPKDGRLTVEAFARGVTLQSGSNSLLDADGSALMLHAKPDDHRTDPSGAAGDRIACGVIQK